MMIEFGVMSKRWSLDAEELTDEVRMAMVLFVGKDVPIAVYNIEGASFLPSDFMKSINMDSLEHDKVIDYGTRIKEVRE